MDDGFVSSVVFSREDLLKKHLSELHKDPDFSKNVLSAAPKQIEAQKAKLQEQCHKFQEKQKAALACQVQMGCSQPGMSLYGNQMGSQPGMNLHGVAQPMAVPWAMPRS